jgi:hypothetical protein
VATKASQSAKISAKLSKFVFSVRLDQDVGCALLLLLLLGK